MALLNTQGSSFSMGAWSRRKFSRVSFGVSADGVITICLDYRARGKTGQLELMLSAPEAESLKKAIRGGVERLGDL